MRISFEGQCPHCNEGIQIVRELTAKMVCEICATGLDSSPIKEETGSKPLKSFVDKNWFESNLAFIRVKPDYSGAWNDEPLKDYLESIHGKKAGTLWESVTYLDKAQAQRFIKEIQSALSS